MAILKIVQYGDPCLRTRAREVTKFSKKVRTLAEDMLDTMYKANGVGLAAPQVGESLRIFVLDVSDPDDPLNPMVFINPKIIKKSGAMCTQEGCLSFPQVYTDVRRYKNVTVKAQDLGGRPFIVESDSELLSKALQHEFDHLNGILFIDHARNVLEAGGLLETHSLPPIDNSMLLEEVELEEEILKNLGIEGD